MSFFRSLITAVAALGLASSVFAADATSNAASSTSPAAPATQQAAPMQTADASATTQQGTTAEQTKVDINKATAKDLMKVKGMTAGKARAVVAYRKKHGDFKTLDDLKDVKGFKKMNEETMKQIQDQLTAG